MDLKSSLYKKSRLGQKFNQIIFDVEQLNSQIEERIQTQKSQTPKKQLTLDQKKLTQMLESYRSTRQSDFNPNQQSIAYQESKISLNTEQSKTSFRKSNNSQSSKLFQLPIQNSKKQNKFQIQRELDYKRKCKKYTNFVIDLINSEFARLSDQSNDILRKNSLKQFHNNLIIINEKITQFKNSLAAFNSLAKDNFSNEKTQLIKMIIQDHDSSPFQTIIYAFMNKIVGKIFQKLNMLDMSIKYFKIAKNAVKYSLNFNSSKLKLKCYKGLGVNFKKIGSFLLSKHYFQKYLQFALIISDYNAEVKAYDQIGIVHMYMDDIVTAKYYHEKFIKGEVESKNSQIRQKAIFKLQYFISSSEYLKRKRKNIQAISIVQQQYQDYSSDESMVVQVSRTKKPDMDNYDSFNENKQLRQQDLNMYLKKIKKEANQNIRFGKHFTENDENENQIVQDDNKFYKTFLRHLSLQKSSGDQISLKQSKKLMLQQKFDYSFAQDKMTRMTIGLTDLKPLIDQMIEKVYNSLQ